MIDHLWSDLSILAFLLHLYVIEMFQLFFNVNGYGLS